MLTLSPESKVLKAELDKLIHSASHYEFDILETIYHDDMKIYMFDEENTLNISDKAGFIAHVTQATMSAEAPNIWAKYHSVDVTKVDGKTYGHILISRKVNLTGVERIVTLSIDFIYESDRWQITREVIFVRKSD